MLDAGPADGDRSRSTSTPLIRRENVLLVVLCVAAVVLFLVTRSLASWSRATGVEEAARAFQRGAQADAAGDTATAVAEFRRAVFNDRTTPEYTLRLAATLGEMPGGAEEAERLLLQLREATPDDSEINYRLARLAAARGDVGTAIRYYNHAMYGLMSDDAEVDRQRIRTELIGVLLDYGDREGAVAELAALGRELPDEAEAHVSAGRLAMRADEYRMALQQFRRAAELAPRNAEAQSEAGVAALALFDFKAAIDHFEAALRLGATGASVTNELAVARLTDGTDPLAPGLPTAQRARRLDEGLDWIAGRLEACPAPAAPVAPAATPPAGAAPEPTADETELERLRRLPQRDLRDPDVIDAALALITRLHGDVVARCPDPSLISQAWTLIGQAHAEPAS